jgi:hypothetical protein
MSRIVENWRIFCEVEQKEKEQGSPTELVFITLEDGTSQGFNACSKCAQLVKAHMDEMAAEQIEAENQKGHKVFETREDIENRGNPELVKRQTSVAVLAKKPESEAPKDEVMDLLRGIATGLNDLTQRVARLEDAPQKGKRSKT